MSRTRSTVSLSNPRNLRGIDDELRKAARLAADLGWTGVRGSNGGIRMFPPEGVEGDPVYLPVGKQDTTLARKITRRILRATPADQVHSHMARMEREAMEAEKSGEKVGPEVQHLFDAMLPVVSEGASFGVASLRSYDDSDLPAEPEPEPEPEVERTVTDERPWLAKKSTRRGTTDRYASDSVIQRTWSDGAVDYVCAVCGPEYTSKKPHAVAAHAGYHTRRSEKEAVDLGGREVVAQETDPDYDPATERVKRLAREILAAFDAIVTGDGQSMTYPELAQAVAEHIIEHRPARTAEDEDGVPMTDTDVLARIRQMVAGDMIVRQQALENRVTELTEEVAVAVAEATEHKTKAEGLRATLATLSELARGEVE